MDRKFKYTNNTDNHNHDNSNSINMLIRCRSFFTILEIVFMKRRMTTALERVIVFVEGTATMVDGMMVLVERNTFF